MNAVVRPQIRSDAREDPPESPPVVEAAPRTLGERLRVPL
jgi:hypothetical protein